MGRFSDTDWIQWVGLNGMRFEFLWSESKNPKLDRKRLTHRDGPSKDGHTGSWAPERANVALDTACTHVLTRTYPPTSVNVPFNT